jgi:hypothetical protein
MSKNLKDRLLPNVLQTRELEIFLLSYFGSSGQSEPNKVMYGDSIVVEYFGKSNKRRHSEIKSIYPLKDRSNTFLDDLEEKAKEALSMNQGIAVGHDIWFNLLPVKGHFRLKDDFQISPVPDDAPQPGELYADHPFIFEYSFPNSSNLLIRNYRKSKRENELALLLNVFIRLGIKKMRGAMKEWVVDLSDVYGMSAKYLQIGYTFLDEDAQQKDGMGFTVPMMDEKLNQIPPDQYYGQGHIVVGDSFGIPANLQESFARYRVLSDKRQQDLLRASYWKMVGSNIFHISQSSAYVALVNAIESLIPPAKPEWCCLTCRQEHKIGLTQLFHDFLETYVPGLPPKYRKELYAIRSKITHGKRLMPYDELEFFVTFNPASNESLEEYRVLSQVVQVAMINWLYSQ